MALGLFRYTLFLTLLLSSAGGRYLPSILALA